LTLLSMARLWEDAFWKPRAPSASSSGFQSPLSVSIVAPIAFLVGVTIALSVFAGPISTVTAQAAEQLLDRNAYVRAVLGEGVPRAAR